MRNTTVAATIFAAAVVALVLITVPAFVAAYFAAGRFAQWMGETTLASVNKSAAQDMAQAGQSGADVESSASAQTLDNLTVGLTSGSVIQAAIICVVVIAIVVAITAVPMMRKSPRTILADAT